MRTTLTLILLLLAINIEVCKAIKRRTIEKTPIIIRRHMQEKTPKITNICTKDDKYPVDVSDIKNGIINKTTYQANLVQKDLADNFKLENITTFSINLTGTVKVLFLKNIKNGSLNLTLFGNPIVIFDNVESVSIAMYGVVKIIYMKDIKNGTYNMAPARDSIK